MKLSSREIMEDAHHSIMVAVGARKRLLCPECQSEDYVRNCVYDRCDVLYNDGYAVRGTMDFSHTKMMCYECGYDG